MRNITGNMPPLGRNHSPDCALQEGEGSVFLAAYARVWELKEQVMADVPWMPVVLMKFSRLS